MITLRAASAFVVRSDGMAFLSIALILARVPAVTCKNRALSARNLGAATCASLRTTRSRMPPIYAAKARFFALRFGA